MILASNRTGVYGNDFFEEKKEFILPFVKILHSALATPYGTRNA
jgi:hypothetical protein